VTKNTFWSQSWADRAILAERFPAVFSGKGEAKKPLAVGIHHQLSKAMPDIPMERIRAALKNYTNGPTYQRNLVAGAPRLDLMGNVVGEVTESDATFAKIRLAGMAKPKRRKPKQAASEPLQLAA